jgi:L-xylulokinase
VFGSPHGAGVPGAWIGLRAHHERGHLLRAVLEGVAFNHRTHLGWLREAFALERPVRVCGGGSRSPEWTALLADTLGLPVEVTDGAEAGARGAALLAAVGLGRYPDVESAAADVVQVVRRHDPDPDRVVALDAGYARYRAAVTALAELSMP